MESKTQVGPLKGDEEELVQEPDRIADLLSLQYSSVHTVPSEKPTFSNTVVPVTTEDIEFDIADISQAIDNSNPTAAAGIDAFSIPLFVFWGKFLDKQEVSSARKHALITPIYKGKSKLDA